jgi:hypothetical protein
MEALGDREVVAVILAGGDPQKVLLGIASCCALRSDRLGTTQSKISNGAGPRFWTTELRHRGGKLGIEGDLNSGIRSCHQKECTSDLVHHCLGPMRERLETRCGRM